MERAVDVGLEFDYVILAATASDAVTDALLYVGVIRAIAGLTVVGPRAIAERLGIEDRSLKRPP